MTLVAPPVWSPSRLDAERLTAIEVFREARMAEPLVHYLEVFEHYCGVVEELLEMTVDLSRIGDYALTLLTDPDMLTVVRYLAGPPIALDDLKVITGTSLAKRRLRGNPEMARQVIQTVLYGLDQGRFPWVEEEREPNDAERRAAAIATASLITSRRLMTIRANDGKQAQEELVDRVLVQEAGFRRVETRTVETLADAPEPGCFCRESLFGDRKADLIVTLRDNRVMPIECKVSNSSTNSVKRLNNDAAAKAEAWIRHFGERGVIPAAVLSGVFKRHNLEQAQRQRLTLFWAHNLSDPFVAFLDAAR